MLIITSDYNYYNIKLDEIYNIVENTLLKHEQKCTVGCRVMVNVKCIAEFLDKIENKIKIITIQRCNINEEMNKVLQSSEGMILLVRIDKTRIVIDKMVF